VFFLLFFFKQAPVTANPSAYSHGRGCFQEQHTDAFGLQPATLPL